MRVVARVGSIWVVILVDSRSTHNFIDSKLVGKLATPMLQHDKLRVIFTNGSCLFIRGECKGVQWQVQGLKF